MCAGISRAATTTRDAATVYSVYLLNFCFTTGDPRELRPLADSAERKWFIQSGACMLLLLRTFFFLRVAFQFG